MAFIPAAEAAVLVALNLHRRGEQTGRELKRVRVSDKTLQEITGRRRLEGRYLEDFAEELLELGWVVIRTHTAWGFLRASAVMGWFRINSSRIGDELAQISAGHLQAVMEHARAEIATPNAQTAEHPENNDDVSEKVEAA